MTEREYEILSKLLVDLFLQSPRRKTDLLQQNVSDDTQRHQHGSVKKPTGGKKHGRKSQES